MFPKPLFLAVLLGTLVAASESHASGKSPSLYDVIKTCRNTYILYHLPLFGSDEDYCDVLRNSYIRGKDVSRRREGRQLDVIDVIKQLRELFDRSRHPRFRALAADLKQCVTNFYDHGSTEYPDSCRIWRRNAKRVWRHRPKVKSYLDRKKREAKILSRMRDVNARFEAEARMELVNTFWTLPEVLDATLRALYRTGRSRKFP